MSGDDVSACAARYWVGHGRWNALAQIVCACAIIVTCSVGVVYNIRMFPRLLCGCIFLFGGVWTITTKDDFRPCWVALRCVYKPCCGERREGRCLQCWLWMQIFCFVLAALVLTVSAITLGEHPTSGEDPTIEPPTGQYAPSVGLNGTLIAVCCVYLIFCSLAIFVFLPCCKAWYFEIPEEANIIDPTVGRLELPPPVTNPQRYSVHRYSGVTDGNRQMVYLKSAQPVTGAPAEDIK